MINTLKQWIENKTTNILYRLGFINVENMVYGYDSKKIHVNLMNDMRGIIYKEINEDNVPVIKMDVIDNDGTVIEEGCGYHGENSFYRKIVCKYPNYLNGIYFVEEETYYINYYKVIGYIKNE